jgi:tetratricopeptide (TPR) repeat protein
LIRLALRHNAHNPAYFSNLAAALREQGKLDEAITACRQAVRIRPDYAEAHCNLGAVLSDQGKPDEAVAAYRRALRIRPDYAEAYCSLGVILRNQGKLDEAVAAYRQAIRIRPDDAKTFSSLGAVLRDQGRLDDSVFACRQAIVLEPNFAEAHNNLGLVLTELGRLSEGRAALEQAVRLAPRNTKFRRDLGETVRLAAGDPHLAELEQLAEDRASLSVGDRIELHFALAKAYDDTGRHAEAFRQWLDGNALKRRQIAYDEAPTLGALDRVRQVFTTELIQSHRNSGQPSSVSVFIVGMPRSGRTLVEQILASHPQLFGGGELKHFPRAVAGIRTAHGSVEFPDLVSGMSGEEFGALGTRYLAEIERLAPAAARITDKMPNNFMAVGLIHLALPNAAIIHVARDPVDTCLSCFTKLFAEEHNYTYDLGELGRFYRHYRALMAHWHRVLPPGRILDVRYEDVVDDLEGQARRIIAHCGLDWDARCLGFHRTERPVRTASATQVRQPIYRSSIGRWSRYAALLQPLLAEIQPEGRQRVAANLRS